MSCMFFETPILFIRFFVVVAAVAVVVVVVVILSDYIMLFLVPHPTLLQIPCFSTADRYLFEEEKMGIS